MELHLQKESFYTSVSPARPNSWEVDEIFEVLADYDETIVSLLLSKVPAIWPVSHSLCFAYMTEGVEAVQLVSAELLEDWVRQLLGVYESKGLWGARQFMADVERFFLAPLRGKDGVAFNDISGQLLPYLRGISGQSFDIRFATLPSTDTQTIYLPAAIDIFTEKNDNILLYKLLLTLQWGQVNSGLFYEIPGKDVDGAGADPLFSAYPNKTLAKHLFAAVQFLRLFQFLRCELPGLTRRGERLCLQLIDFISPGDAKEGTDQSMAQNDQATFLKNLLTDGLQFGAGDRECSSDDDRLSWLAERDFLSKNVFNILPDLYNQMNELPGAYDLGAAALLLGEFDFVRAEKVIRIRREQQKKQFIALLAGYLSHLTNSDRGEDKESADRQDKHSETTESIKDSIALLVEQGEEKQNAPSLDILINNEGGKFADELVDLIKSIEADLGSLPEAYVQAAEGLAGKGINKQEPDENWQKWLPENHGVSGNTYSYDEWDYRRGGYRSDWCQLYEKSLNPVRSTFIADTLTKYHGQLHTLRRQFETLRSRDRFARRRRHGDDIDLDALVEALGDSRAGLSPSDRLFVQLLRDERDITTIFLVDMSNSTEGWVGNAMKESLVLLAEAIEVAGDSYAIYGFSGMRRSKSELYLVKELDELYGFEVKGRIAAIAPKEYTRMGPPIRHLTKKLQGIQSKIRLLVVISDGKPEDYDDYKGQYAIEDTRKALLEARGRGVNSFCVTIDKAAHNYLCHMFGRGNYIFVDKVSSLPGKMIEMYRLLTR